MSPLHVSRSSTEAGLPVSSLAAHNAVAAFPDPPPRPAPWGTVFWRSHLKVALMPVLFLKRLNALMTRLEASVGTSGTLHMSWSEVEEPDSC